MKAEIKKRIQNYYKKGTTLSDEFFNLIENTIASISKPRFKMIKFEKQFFTKSINSLVDSISRKMSPFKFYKSVPDGLSSNKLFCQDCELCLDRLADFFRINICVINNKDFSNQVIEVLQRLIRIDGMSLNTRRDCPYKNAFNNTDGCRDFKVYLLYKDYPFEIQFHNKSSEDINLNTHGLYQVYRASDLKIKYKKLLEEDRIGLYSLVVPPVFDENEIMLKGVGYGI